MFHIKKNYVQINEQIRDKEVRLIASSGEMVGIVSGRDAQQRADEQELDLVKISPNATPPVCKIMDYGKYMFELAKKEKEAKKKQKTITVKEIRLSPKIEDHDYNFKLKNGLKFLNAGDKLKVSIRFRGREMQYTNLGRAVLLRFADAVKEVATMDRNPRMEGRSMSMMLIPIKK